MTDWTDVAAWYDVLNPWGESDEFYLSLVNGADRVLDVGCGTGTLLSRARREGHTGRLAGLDPDPAALSLARAKVPGGIDWLLADAASITWRQEFDLATMTGHAFQCLVTDEDVRMSLAAIAAALVPGAQFAFETRNPADRAWERWHGAFFQARNPDGDQVTVSYEVLDVTGDVVTITETLAGQWWDKPRTEAAKLRFIDPDTLTAMLDQAGYAVMTQYGDWERGPVTGDSAELITVARVRLSARLGVTVRVGVPDRLGAIAGAGLEEDPVHVRLHGGLADEQVAGDLPVRPPGARRDQPLRGLATRARNSGSPPDVVISSR